jgi:hypothetical protein
VRVQMALGQIMPIPGEMLKRGWGVMRLRPWHLAGVFASSIDAEALAETLGAAYTIKYGEHTPGSGEFAFADSPTSTL